MRTKIFVTVVVTALCLMLRVSGVCAAVNGAGAHSSSMSVGSGIEPIEDMEATREGGSVADVPVPDDGEEYEIVVGGSELSSEQSEQGRETLNNKDLDSDSGIDEKGMTFTIAMALVQVAIVFVVVAVRKKRDSGVAEKSSTYTAKH